GRNIDLVLMDVCTLNDESGLEATSRIKRDSPSTKVIVMTSMPEYTFPEKARLAGADSFWYKDYGNSGLSDVVRRTLADESVWPENRYRQESCALFRQPHKPAVRCGYPSSRVTSR